ncbi:MAG: 30S ribosomal protein S13, partial [Turneriella sp.]
GIPLTKRVHELSEDEVGKIKKIIDADYTVEGALRSKVQLDMKRLVDIGSFRGSRHRKGLPARGQRTKTNARTRKGRRVTVAGKKQAPSKG